jgi:hypothetical protein
MGGSSGGGKGFGGAIGGGKGFGGAIGGGNGGSVVLKSVTVTLPSNKAWRNSSITSKFC